MGGAGRRRGGARPVSVATASEPDWAERLAAAGLSDAAALLADALPALAGTCTALVKPGLGGRERWRWQLAPGDGPILYIKRYQHTPWREQLDRFGRQNAGHSRAWWEFRQSRELHQRYVPVVRAIAVAEDMHGPCERRSAVIFEQAAGDAFDRVWPRLCAARAPLTRGAARHELTRALARLVSAFHQTGVCHRDLYLCHIFADLDPAAVRAPHFTLIDLARTHRPTPWRRWRWLIKDLSQLDCSAQQIGATRADRWRFLVAYLGLESHAPRVRLYARRIARKSRQILQRIARKAAAS
jgi:heptose I phosphotransferase